MIVKIFEPVKGFPAVRYNTNKMDRGKGELMKVANFGALQMMSRLRPQDYQDYLLQLASLNKRVVYPQLHAAISGKGKELTKQELTVIAEKWLEAMGYGAQPYLVIFHKDTANYHVHVVTCRVDRDGKKISSAFERVRAVKALNKIVGVQEDVDAKTDLLDALAYRFSTKAQFALILERRGYVVRENDLIKFGTKQLTIPALKFKIPDKGRATQLKAIFQKYRKHYSTVLRPEILKVAGGLEKTGKGFTSDFAVFVKQQFGLDLVFHASDDKPPYGYTVIDQAQKNVFKGGEVLSLKILLEPMPETKRVIAGLAGSELVPGYIEPINISIADDVDDEQVYGKRRRKKTI